MGRSEGHIHLHDRLRVFTLWKEKLMHIGGICIILGVLYTGTMTWNTVIMFFFFKFLCNWEIAWLKHDLDETRLWTPAHTLSAPELWECGKRAVNTCTGNWGSCFCLERFQNRLSAEKQVFAYSSQQPFPWRMRTTLTTTQTCKLGWDCFSNVHCEPLTSV